MGPQREGMLSADSVSIVEEMSSLLPAADKKAILDHPELGQNMVDMFNEGLKDGIDGWVDDSLGFVRPWGFSLDEVKAPVILYHGDTDLMVPFAHGKWIVEHLPKDKVQAHMLQGHGHISIFLEKVYEMLEELLTFWNKAQ